MIHLVEQTESHYCESDVEALAFGIGMLWIGNQYRGVYVTYTGKGEAVATHQLTVISVSFPADGVMYTFGIFYVDISAKFNSSKAETSWIASIMIGVTFGAGTTWRNSRMRRFHHSGRRQKGISLMHALR